VKRIAVAIVVIVGSMRAQTPGPQFEVASVKHNVSGATGDQIRIAPGGRFEIGNQTLRMMIQNAYRAMPFQIVGGPRWVDTERFDVVAKSEGDFSVDGAFLRLKALLADRFALKMHEETREESVYLLTVAKGGPKVEHAEGTCVPRDPQNPPQRKTGEQMPKYCGNMRRTNLSIDGEGEPLADRAGFTVATLTGQLSLILGRAVLDRTGLTGIFNFRLRWAPEQGAALTRGAAPGDDSAPSIFTAIQEQLGLKLESGKGPVPVLVIDHIEEPSEN
jgi:uncharacterized protein (TIGR03435 family)